MVMKRIEVVVATDGSVEADISGAVANRLPLPKDSRFKVAMVTHLPVSVFMPFAPEGLVAGEQVAADGYRIEHKIAKQTVDRVAQRLREHGFEAEGVVLEGNTSDQLLELIKNDNADMILAGCGVNSNFAAFFLGSVSRKLVLYSQASVLVGRHYQDTPAEGSYSRLSAKEKLDVLVAVDGTKGSELAIESLENLTSPVFGNLYIACIESMPYAEFGMDPSSGIPNYEAALRALRETAENAASRLRSCADKLEVLTGFGRASTQISHFAREKNLDLVMLGANRHGAIERFLLGSTAYETATGAPCSVLIFRDVLRFQA